jgi:hypothetical protein
MFEAFLRGLRQPEYIHVLINPLPLYGLLIGLLAMIVALILGSRPAQVTALILVLLAAASAWPVAHFGEEAFDRVLSMADDDGQAWLRAHEERSDKLIYLFHALAVLTLLSLIAPKKWPKSALPFMIATLVLTVISLGAGGYIAYAGGKIRHREFRNEPPPLQIKPIR